MYDMTQNDIKQHGMTWQLRQNDKTDMTYNKKWHDMTGNVMTWYDVIWQDTMQYATWEKMEWHGIAW